jgi:hypothetical protein
MNKQNSYLQALVGYFIDIYKIANFTFVNPHSYTKFRQIDSYRKKTQSQIFIETGTYLGVTTSRCSSIFKQIYTIELDRQLAQKASSFLSAKSNVQVIEGDAVEVLKILPFDELDNILVFLDGHYSGGVTACGDLPEPALEEIIILAEHKSKINCVIIDDFRCFGSEAGFPSKSILIECIEKNFPEFVIDIHLDQIIFYAPNFYAPNKK